MGLDVVKNIMEDVGGNLSIHSTIGQGSAFSISVPLNLASIECVRFRVGQYRFSIPARHVYHFLEYEPLGYEIREIKRYGSYILYETGWCLLLISAGSIPGRGDSGAGHSGICEGRGEGGLLSHRFHL